MKKPLKRAAAPVGEIQLPLGWRENAVPGNKAGNAHAYQLAAWLLKSRIAVPAEMSEWLAERLEGLAAALADASDTKMHRVLPALRLTASRRGNKGDSALEVATKEMLAWDVYYIAKQRGMPGCLSAAATLDQVFEEVARIRNAALKGFQSQGADIRGLLVSPAKVEAAWNARRKLDPSIPELN